MERVLLPHDEPGLVPILAGSLQLEHLTGPCVTSYNDNRCPRLNRLSKCHGHVYLAAAFHNRRL